MKKNYLLLLLLISIFKISAQGVGSISIVSIPASTAAGTNASIQITYVSDVNCILTASLRQTNANVTSVNWSIFFNQLVTTNLPATAGSTVTLTYPILAGQATSASLPAGVQYTYAFKLTKTGGTDFAYNDGTAANLTSVTAAAVTNTVNITSAPTAVVAGGSVLVNFNYTLINAGKVKVEVRKFDGTTYISGAAGLVVDAYIDPAAATTTTPVTASKTLLIPSGTIPSTGLIGAENYKVVVTIYTSAFGYIADKKSNITITANHPSWNGATSGVWTDATNWSTGIVPNQNSNVTIAALGTQPTINTNVNINSLTVAAGATLIVAGLNLTVSGAIANNGTMTLANNSNLIQGGTTNTNTGNITVNRNSSALLYLDYSLWSSPVTNAAFYLKTFSPATLNTRFYNFNTTYNVGVVNGAFSAISNPTTTNFTAGKGYLIRMPDNADAVTPTAYSGAFTGVPNSGTISVALVDGLAAGLRYNLIGNPYPSPLTISTFVTDNALNIESTLYFWRKTNGVGTAYCTWVPGPGTGTFTTNGNSQSVNPLGVIQTGQGFFVEAKSGATSLIFNNLQRVADNTGQFFKTKQVKETNRIWLNATNATGAFSQMAVTYTTDATQGVDNFDGKYINDSPIALTSNINSLEYTIQGRALPFDPSDVVNLNFKTNAAGDYTIALDHFDGLFAGQDVYLKDNITGSETDLKAGNYIFTATAGIDNTRFSLKYQKTLKVDLPEFNENSISVFRNKGTLYLNSGSVAISNIKVFDIQGRLIAEQKSVKATTAVIKDLKANNQVLIVKISDENNNVVTKKVVN